MDNIEAKYRTIIREFVPFDIVAHGPHLTKTGAVILEVVAHSDQFFLLRDAASRDISFLPEDVERGIHAIVHSTIGYVAEASHSEILNLHETLARMRSETPGISTRIREARLAGTRNRELTADQRRIPFEGRRCPSSSSAKILELLNEIKRCSVLVVEDPILTEIVRDEAIYWIEDARDARVWSTAYQILCHLPRGELRLES